MSELVVRDAGSVRRGRVLGRLAFGFGFLLATVAVVFLAFGAIAMRDTANEQRIQTKCQQATAYAAYLSTPKVSVSQKDLGNLFGLVLKCGFP